MCYLIESTAVAEHSVELYVPMLEFKKDQMRQRLVSPYTHRVPYRARAPRGLRILPSPYGARPGDSCAVGLVLCRADWLLCPPLSTLARLPDMWRADPFIFAATWTDPSRGCRSCGTDLTLRTNPSSEKLTSEITAINKAYRDALLSITPNSTWLGHVTSAQFQSFVDDTLQLLERQNHREQMRCGKRRQNTFASGQTRLSAIVDLILNAIPTADRQTQCNRHRRSLKLWTKILSSVHELEVCGMKESSRCWPATIRVRFDHAWANHERTKRWWRTDHQTFGSPAI